jgi:hypothetical protein
MIALSWSRIQDMACPFRFHAKHIAKSYTEPESPAMRIGSAIHEIMAEYRTRCLVRGLQSDVEYFDEVIPKITGQLHEDEAQEVKDLMDGVMDSPAVLVPTNTTWHAVEQKMGYSLNGDGFSPCEWLDPGVAFRLVADFAYVTGKTLHIIDDKTGWGSADPAQLVTYAAFYVKCHERLSEIEEIKLGFLDHRRGKYVPVMECSVGDAEKEFDEKLAMIRAHIETVNSWTEFPAVPGALCSNCQAPDCPAVSEAETALVGAMPPAAPTIPTEITTPEQAERAVEFLVFADQILKQIKDRLKAYVKDHGAVQAAGKSAELRDIESWSLTDPIGFIKSAIGFGLPQEKVLSAMKIDKKGLERLVRDDEVRAMLMAKYGQSKTYQRFDLYKDSEGEW